jgi:hypothetical protein
MGCSGCRRGRAAPRNDLGVLFGPALRAAPALALALALGVAHAEPVPQAGPGAPPQTEQQPISQAETLLFMTNHLKELQTPSRLHYAFRKRGTLEQGFSDTVDIDITSGPDGTKKGSARFLSGPRQVASEGVEHVEGNPVVMFYLDREIREMSRLTGGAPNHFRRMIRTALAEAAQIKDVDIQFGGRKMRAQQITISPYQSDPFHDRYRDQRLMSKQYLFTMCDTIPGVVYEMRAVVPTANGSSKDEPVIDETLTFKSAGNPR